MSMDRLLEKIAALQNPTVAGLDPKLSYIPEHIRAASYEKYGKTLEGLPTPAGLQQGAHRRVVRHCARGKAPGSLL